MKRAEWLGPLVFYVVLAVLLSPSAATGEGVFGYHDLRHHHLPWRAWAAQRWAAGEVPWWASGAGNGFPLLAEGEGGFFYPPTMLLFLALPAGLALNLSLLGHHVLAAMGFWAFARASGLRGMAPTVAGLVWGFSGFLVSHALYLGMQNGLAWVGWLLFAARTGRTWLTIVGVGMLGLAGHPQGAAFAGALVAAWALVHLSGRERLRWVAGAVGGVGVAAGQLVASLELSRFSMREGGVDGAFANVGAMPPQELVGFVLPRAFGFDRPADVLETYYHRGTGYWGAGVNSWEMCVYVGIPVVALAAAGLRRSRFWTVTLLLAVLLMLGGPLWALVRLLPGFGYFRFPVRFALVAIAALAMLAAHGVDRLRRGGDAGWLRRPLLWTVALFTLSTGVVRLGLDTRQGELRAVLSSYFQRQVDRPPLPAPSSALAQAALPVPEPEDAAAIPKKVARILADLRTSADPRSRRVWWPVLLLLATALLLRRPRLLTLVVAGDLLAFGADYHPTRPMSDALAAPAWLGDPMREPGGARTTVLDRRVAAEFDGDLLAASLGLPLGTSDVLLPSPLLLVHNDALLAAGGLDVGDKGIVKVARWVTHPGISRRLAVRWIASVHEVPGLIPRVRGRYNVWEDPAALLRARVVPCVEGAAGVDAAFEAVLAADPQRTAVIEGVASQCAEGEGGAARIVDYADQHVEIEATGPGTLVLADTAYPGWSATVDGAPVPIQVVDLILRGVTLPAGEHRVVFAWSPGLAGWLAAAGALLLAGAVSVPVVVGIRARRG
jgi:hypothetical protein